MNCVLTIAVGDKYERLGELTHPTMAAYAHRIGAEFVVINQSVCSTPHWEKFQIYDLLNKYHRIIYVDTDIIIRDDTPDLFEMVPESQIGLFNEARFVSGGREMSIVESCKAYDQTLRSWNGKYYNTGVMVISRRHKHLFKKPEKEVFNFYEQGYLNVILAKTLETAGNELSVYELPHHFNRMTCMDCLTGEERFASYMIHYAGYPNLDFILGLIPQDIAHWAATGPDYDFQRHILVDAQGGLGDQVCAEPAIRFLKENVYPDDDITVVTHFPMLFKHLDVPVFSHGEFQRKNDTPYYHVLTLPGPDTIMWRTVSNLLSHTVDFTSMALMKRILPTNNKQIQLRLQNRLAAISEVVSVIGITDLSKMILVHAGRHWESKTFPVSWWQSAVDGLQKAGFTVCLIGQDDATRGVVNVVAREGMYDTRNLLSLEGLIVLIEAAWMVVSNDSAPIHLAGAFDNEIVLIPTCKHPDHILPWRNGSQTYKASALYKKLMSDEYSSQPTELYGVLADKTVGEFEDYLPESDAVIDYVKSRSSKMGVE